MQTASDYMRRTDEEKKSAYWYVTQLVASTAKKMWEQKKYVIQTDYEKSLMNGKLFGTRFAIDIKGKSAQDVYQTMNDNMLSRDELSKQFQKLLEDGKVFPLGDAVVVPHGAIVNPAKPDFDSESEPVLGITFNLVLPEDIPDDYEFEETGGKEDEH